MSCAENWQIVPNGLLRAMRRMVVRSPRVVAQAALYGKWRNLNA
ncbi:hypothetical protein BSIN_1409 [Burkholderia singularis]|uniref:Uncharacterized protein n=1 Tax=Burkholderia singularis TaxID=1503053 RepID=A0A238GYP9_9BURK|nr:hypothetical protein BSIN_1409 [Burkholderia singularis]